MITPEEKARIARENGAKSKGPTTQQGKDRSRANGLKTGDRATTLRHLAQPHPGILCNEDSHAFFQLFHDLIKAYNPIGQLATDIVREIAIARTEITRTQHVKAAAWNRQIHLEQAKAAHLPAELIPVETAINTGLAMPNSTAPSTASSAASSPSKNASSASRPTSPNPKSTPTTTKPTPTSRNPNQMNNIPKRKKSLFTPTTPAPPPARPTNSSSPAAS
jgi:hypothetical protein